MGVESLRLAIWFLPMGLGGCVLSIIGGKVLHILSGTVILLITGIAIIAASLLFALLPEHANYWEHIFPAMICGTISIDIVFNRANIFVSNVLPAGQ